MSEIKKANVDVHSVSCPTNQLILEIPPNSF